jgi:hypothetical protein
MSTATASAAELVHVFGMGFERKAWGLGDVEVGYTAVCFAAIPIVVCAAPSGCRRLLQCCIGYATGGADTGSRCCGS